MKQCMKGKQYLILILNQLYLPMAQGYSLQLYIANTLHHNYFRMVSLTLGMKKKTNSICVGVFVKNICLCDQSSRRCACRICVKG